MSEDRIKALDQQRLDLRGREDADYLFAHHRERWDIIQDYLAEGLAAGDIIKRFKADHRTRDQTHVEPRLLQRIESATRYLARQQEGRDD